MSSMVSLTVTSNINSFETIRRFPKEITIKELKEKLELLTGAPSSSMKIKLLDKCKTILAECVDDDSLLGSYDVEDGLYLHVIDPCHKAGQFEDTSAVEKFELSKEEYAKRSDTFLAFKEKMKLGRSNEEEDMKQKLEIEKKLIETFKVGDSCEVAIPGKPVRYGTIMYLGTTDFKPGYWVGVKYDGPHGKNDGSVKGKRYFECAPNHGGFVKPHDVTVIDFPKENSDDEI